MTLKERKYGANQEDVGHDCPKCFEDAVVAIDTNEFRCHVCGFNYTLAFVNHDEGCTYQDIEHIDIQAPRGFGYLGYDNSHMCGQCVVCDRFECEGEY